MIFQNRKFSKKTKEKMRQKALARKEKFGWIVNPETIKKARINNLGKKLSKERSDKLHASWRGKHHTKKSKEKIRLGHEGKPKPWLRGKNSVNWKGGITPIEKAIRKSLKYKNWRKAVFIKDNYTCQECGKKSGNGKKVILNAHHLKPFSLFFETRFDINNGKTLCIDCHSKTDTYGGKMDLSDELFVDLLKQVRLELHSRMGTDICSELHFDCFDCKTRMFIGFINSWIDILTPFKPKK